MLTAHDEALERDIRGRLPADNRGLRFVEAQYTEDTLKAALEALDTVWPEVQPGIPKLKAAVDSAGNRLVVTVSGSDAGRAAGRARDLSDRLGVPVGVAEGPPDRDVVCTDRDHCYSPYKAGDIIRAGSATSGNTCTMGFHIVIGGDKQCLTAGHCGCIYTSTNWYHTGNGLVGGENGTLVGAATPVDIMKIQMPDTQASALVFGTTGDMDAPRIPVSATMVTP